MEAIRRDSDYTANDGCLASVNVRYYYDGLICRRNGMARSANVGGYSAIGFWSPTGGQFTLVVQPSGSIESVGL